MKKAIGILITKLNFLKIIRICFHYFTNYLIIKKNIKIKIKIFKNIITSAFLID